MPLLRTSALRSLLRPRRRSPSPSPGPGKPGAEDRFLRASRAVPGSTVRRKLICAPVSDASDASEAEEDEPEASNSDGDGPALTVKRRPALCVDVSDVDSDAAGGTQARARRALQAASRPTVPADGNGPAFTAKKRPAHCVDVSDVDSDAAGGKQASARRALQAARRPTGPAAKFRRLHFAPVSDVDDACAGDARAHPSASSTSRPNPSPRGAPPLSRRALCVDVSDVDASEESTAKREGRERLRIASPVNALGLLPPSGSVLGRVEAMTRGHMLCRLHAISAPGCGCWNPACQNKCKAIVREHKAEIATEASSALAYQAL